METVTARIVRNPDGSFFIHDNMYMFTVEVKDDIYVPVGIETVNQHVVSENTKYFLVFYESESSQEFSGKKTLEIANTSLGDNSSIAQSATYIEDDKARWTENATKLLLTAYAEQREKYELGHLKTHNKIWENIKNILEKNNDYFFTCQQIENKWKSLERSYKNVMDNKKLTERGRKTCPFQKELDDILSKRHSVIPKYTLATLDIPGTSSTDTSVAFSEWRI